MSSSSTSNTSMPFGRPRLALGRPAPRESRSRRFSPATISCTPSVQPAMTRSSGNVAGLPRRDRAVEHLAVGRPARVVDRDDVVVRRMLVAGARREHLATRGRTRSSRRRPAARRRRRGLQGDPSAQEGQVMSPVSQRQPPRGERWAWSRPMTPRARPGEGMASRGGGRVRDARLDSLGARSQANANRANGATATKWQIRKVRTGFMGAPA